MRAFLQAAALALAVAACGQSSERGNGQGAAPQREAANEQADSHEITQRRLLALPETARNGVFLRAILDADLPCVRLSGSRQAGEISGYPVWTARCLHGDTWTLVIGDRGTIQVLNPNEARAAGLGGNSQ